MWILHAGEVEHLSERSHQSAQDIFLFARWTAARLVLATAALALIPSHAGAVSDACSLLTIAQVEQVLGVSVDAGKHLFPNDQKPCSWEENGHSGGTGRNVRVSLTDVKYFRPNAPPAPIVEHKMVPGLGEAAYFSKVSGRVPVLHIKKGETHVELAVRTSKLGEDEATAGKE